MSEGKKKENIVAGTVGAFLGSLLGVVCIVAVGQLGYVAAISGVVMAVCALKGYEMLGGGLSKKGAVIASVLVLAMTCFANRLDWAITVAGALDVGLVDAFGLIGILLDKGAIEGGAYWGNLIMLYLFTLMGAVPTIISGLKGNQQPAFPEEPGIYAEGASAQEQPEGQLEIYPAEKGWTLRPRLSMAFIMVFPLIVAFLMLAGFYGTNNNWRWLFATSAALLMTIFCMILALMEIKLLRADEFLMVRGADGILWRVELRMLNAMEPYRFSGKLGAWQAIKWHKLTPEEQDMARHSIARAMEDLKRGRIFKGSVLNRVVVPLTDLTIVKEDSWQWKTTYLAGGGVKKAAIAKVYSGLRPTLETEPPQGPMPYRWGMCVASIVCTLALIAVGLGVGALLENRDSTPVRGDQTAASVPATTETYELDGITYQMDGSYVSQGADEYLDEATGAVYTVSVAHGADEDAAVSRLVQPIGDYRMDAAFEGFQFDRVDSELDSNLSELTARNGAEYLYNIVTVRFTDGRACHVGVALSAGGTLVTVEAVHGKEKDEEKVKSTLLFILESVEITSEEKAPSGVEITQENYQTLFQPTVDMGYEHIGTAYFKAPEDMFGREAFLDAYLPYGDQLEYLKDGYQVQSTAHGMRVSVTMFQSGESAQAVVDRAYQELVDSGVDIYEEGVYDSVYVEEYDAAYQQLVFFEDNRTKPRISILYADVKQQDFYLCAQITYLPEQMDDAYPALVEELSDVFGLSLPEIDPMNEE